MSKVIFVSLCMVLLILSVYPACSQPVQPATPAKAATPAEAPKAPTANPVSTIVPSAQPQQPVAQPPQPVEKPTSFQSVLYSDDKYGYSIKYPKGWIKKDVSGDIIFWVMKTEVMTADSVYIRVIPKTADYVKAIKESLNLYPGLQGFIISPKLDSSGATATSSNTSAYEAKLTVTVSTYTLRIYGLAVDKGDNTIVVIGLTAGEGNQIDLLKEIAQTITFK